MHVWRCESLHIVAVAQHNSMKQNVLGMQAVAIGAAMQAGLV